MKNVSTTNDIRRTFFLPRTCARNYSPPRKLPITISVTSNHSCINILNISRKTSNSARFYRRFNVRDFKTMQIYVSNSRSKLFLLKFVVKWTCNNSNPLRAAYAMFQQYRNNPATTGSVGRSIILNNLCGTGEPLESNNHVRVGKCSRF